MSTIAYEDLQPSAARVKNVRWADLAVDDVGQVFGFPEHADRAIQVSGDFSDGGVGRIAGRNAPDEEWATLTDSKGNALEVTEAGLYQITEVTRELQVSVPTGDESTSLTFSLVARGQI